VKDNQRGHSYGGWYCAAITLAQSMPRANLGITRARLRDIVEGLPFLIDGWVNPFVMIYLVLVAFHLSKAEFRGARHVRRAVAYAVLICVIDCWIVMAICGLFPLIGHLLWIGGILLIISPEFFDLPNMRPRNLPAPSR